MRYLVAVSGGIDSTALLHMLVQQAEHELIVAHFDHGIRSDSAADARFVEGLAKQYNLPFVKKREELGVNTSEETARERRYKFLFSEAKKRDAVVVTAHHADDVIETIAINIVRGTGWRGIGVLDNPQIIRPLLTMTKQEVLSYALERRLEWVEDSTNSSNVYLRNRIRHAIAGRLSLEQKRKILTIWQQQVALKRDIDQQVGASIHQNGEYERYPLIVADPIVACELLRAMVVARAGIRPTRPQVERALMAVKTARSRATHEIGDGVVLRFLTRTFLVETP